MSAAEAQLQAEDVIDNVSLPQGKRKAEDSDEGSETANKSLKLTEDSSPTADVTTAPLPDALQVKQLPTKGRENRLEQNRKAARESRRRKKVMIEELQRSVIFFSRANGALKQQNDELTRQLMQAQMHVAQHKQEGDKIAAAAASPVEKVEETPTAEEKKAASEEQKKADTVATQAIFESQGFPAAAARAAAQAVNGSLVEKHAAAAATASANNLPAMQPGATMQAMANFQQAAAAAMQQAMGQMKGVPGLTQMAATPVGSNPQHAFTDAMTAIAMQQAAAAAAAGQHLMMQGNSQLLPAIMNQIPQTVVQQTPVAPVVPIADETAKKEEVSAVKQEESTDISAQQPQVTQPEISSVPVTNAEANQASVV